MATKTGIFEITPIVGADYETLTHKGRTGNKGEFVYEEGESITFSIGGFVLGTAMAQEKITPSNLSSESAGKLNRIANDRVTNTSRLLLSLRKGNETSTDAPIVIDDGIRQACKGLNLKNLIQDQAFFADDPQISELCSALGVKIVSPAFARNCLRRAMEGITMHSDIKIPLRDGGYVLADIFMPEEEGQHPVIMSFAGYGKAFWFGVIRTEDDFEKFQAYEDDYFSGKPHHYDFINMHIMLEGKDPVPEGVPGIPPFGSKDNANLVHTSEYFERANTRDWVPRGYVVMNVESRGLGDVPGKAHQFGRPEADDYYDVIEWAGVQPWSNGKVGIYGASYYAMNAFNVASLQPPHLAAMVVPAGDIDHYRDNMHFGGLACSFTFTVKASNGEWAGIDHRQVQDSYEWDDPTIFGHDTDTPMASDASLVNVPFYTAIPLETPFIHTRGTSEVFINSSTPIGQKRLDVMSETGIHYWMYDPYYLDKHQRFFDYWLKGEGEGLADEKPVNLMIRTGNGGYYVQRENEWPIARTMYKKLHLGAVSAIPGDPASPMVLADQPIEGSVTYNADLPDDNPPYKPMGAAFCTAPLEEDMVIAGYCKVRLFASSTTDDMKVFVHMLALDEDNHPVPFGVDTHFDKGGVISGGALKFSHRKEDPEKTTAYRPYHTHQEKDCQKLAPGEIVEATVEMPPTTARLKKGWKLLLTVTPVGAEMYEPHGDYVAGSENTLYTGPDHDSYLQLALV